MKDLCVTEECWSGGDSDVQYYRDGVSESGCVDRCYQTCTEHSKFCFGKHNANYVYKISKIFTCILKTIFRTCTTHLAANAL